jgi:diacylglycerol kinase family enzyme
MSLSAFGPVAVIADPQAGQGRVGGSLAAVEKAIVERGLEYRWEVAASRADVERLAAAALDDGIRFLAAVGDDTTVQDVINGMFRDGRTIVEEPVLAVIPAGTSSDLVRSFGLSQDIEGSVGHLLGEQVYPFDVMKIQTLRPDGGHGVRYAHNVAEIGFHADAWLRRDRMPARLGNARRFLGFWSAYVRTRRVPLRIEVDTRTHDLVAWSVIVGNAQFAEEGLRLSPRSFPGDGVLDVLVFTGPRSDAYRMLPRIFRHGDHVPDPGIKELRSKLVLRIETDRPLPVVADGIAFGTTPASFQVVPRQVMLKL